MTTRPRMVLTTESVGVRVGAMEGYGIGAAAVDAIGGPAHPVGVSVATAIGFVGGLLYRGLVAGVVVGAITNVTARVIATKT